MNATKLERVQCVKDLGVRIASSLQFPKHCEDASGIANRMLDYINRNLSLKNKGIILSLYTRVGVITI